MCAAAKTRQATIKRKLINKEYFQDILNLLKFFRTTFIEIWSPNKGKWFPVLSSSGYYSLIKFWSCCYFLKREIYFIILAIKMSLDNQPLNSFWHSLITLVTNWDIQSQVWEIHLRLLNITSYDVLFTIYGKFWKTIKFAFFKTFNLSGNYNI